MSSCRFSSRIRTPAVVAFAAVVLAVAGAADKPPIRSGRDIGQPVPSFYVRAVTGPLRNKSVCYVCRNGSRPCVMILFRNTGPALGKLLKEIDKVVDRNRVAGLRSLIHI